MLLAPGAFVNQPGDITDPDFLRVVFKGRQGILGPAAGIKPHVNILDFRRSSAAFPGGTLATFLTNMLAVIQVELLDCMTTDFQLDTIEAVYLPDPLSIPVVDTQNAPGTIAQDPQPSFDAVTIRKRTSVPSRSFRGSMHVGSVPETFTTKNVLNATGTAAWDLLMAQMQLLVDNGVSDGAQTWAPVVLSPTLSTWNVSPRVFTGAAIETFVYNLRVGSMTRRKQKTTTVA